MASLKTCTFAKGATSITLRSPAYPEPGGYEPRQLVGRTWGGVFKIADLGAAAAERHELELIFTDLTRTEWNNLRGFIVTTCGWATSGFTYTDPWATAHANMRYVGGLEAARSSKGDRWAVTIRIGRDMEA
jgi:hypothetical protein